MCCKPVSMFKNSKKPSSLGKKKKIIIIMIALKELMCIEANYCMTVVYLLSIMFLTCVSWDASTRNKFLFLRNIP